jgi:hypothetical protein
MVMRDIDQKKRAYWVICLNSGGDPGVEYYTFCGSRHGPGLLSPGHSSQEIDSNLAVSLDGGVFAGWPRQSHQRKRRAVQPSFSMKPTPRQCESCHLLAKQGTAAGRHLAAGTAESSRHPARCSGDAYSLSAICAVEKRKGISRTAPGQERHHGAVLRLQPELRPRCARWTAARSLLSWTTGSGSTLRSRPDAPPGNRPTSLLI